MCEKCVKGNKLSTIVPQQSKYLTFAATVLIRLFEFEQRYERPVRVLSFTEWRSVII